MTSVKVGTWNLEYGDAEPATLANQIRKFDLGRYDIWGFSEVANGNVLRKMANALSEDSSGSYKTIIGDTESSDKLGIAYNKNIYSPMSESEIDEMDADNPFHRNTLIGEFRHNETGWRMIFAVNHFARGDRSLRKKRVGLMNKWAAKKWRHGIPIIAVGDYNFDWDIRLKRGNRSFDLFMSFGIFDWIMPYKLIKTNLRKQYNSILDFIFLADPGDDLIEGKSSVLLESLTIDNRKNSEHRPVVAELIFNT